MAGKKEFVQLIRYQFSSANLFSNQSSPTSRYKTEESAQNYAGLCCKELQQLYPNAIVEVIPAGPELEEDQSNFVETYVETWSDGEQVPDLEEPQIVDELCRRIFEGFEWLVSRNRILVSQAPEFTEIPPSVLRWACNNDLVKGAEKSTGFWIFPLEQLPEVRKQLRFADHNEISGMLSTQKHTVVCYMEDVKDIFLFNLPQDIRFLVVLKQDFENSLLRPNNSLFLICRTAQNVQVELEHFIDVEKVVRL